MPEYIQAIENFLSDNPNLGKAALVQLLTRELPSYSGDIGGPYRRPASFDVLVESHMWGDDPVPRVFNYGFFHGMCGQIGMVRKIPSHVQLRFMRLLYFGPLGSCSWIQLFRINMDRNGLDLC